MHTPSSRRSTPVVLAFLVTSGIASSAQTTAALPPLGEWDGVTASAQLDGPYEDVRQSGKSHFLSYSTMPWRAYMDTWSAERFPNSLGVAFNVGGKNADAVAQVLSESGIRHARVEFGWGDFDFATERLTGYKRQKAIDTLRMFQKYKIRPLILLNSHHAGPCPFKSITVQLTQDAKKGDTTIKVKDTRAIKVGYTGPMHAPEYCAAKPLITKVDADGTCHLSGGLGNDLAAGPQTLFELKYLPLHGTLEKDATPEQNALWAASSEATTAGWMNYVRETAEMAVEALGTKGQADAGFDMEVWNELTFGSNFLNINNYYDKKFKFSAPLSYARTRPVLPNYRPDAVTSFKQVDMVTLFARTVDFMTEHAKEYPGVAVDNGFDNQWPYDSGSESWPGQGAISRHFYTGPWTEISPQKVRAEMGTSDAFGNLDGVKVDNKDWYNIVPGSNFVPTFRAGLPEWGYTNFQEEKLITDTVPDSRFGLGVHGRYTHNGDFHTVPLWQTEFNYNRDGLMKQILKDTGAARDDPRMLALDDRLGGKFALRSYLFQNHKGLERLYMFAPGDGPYAIGMFSPLFFKALKANDGKLTPEIRAMVPSFYKGLEWICKQMDAPAPVKAPRPLRVDSLTEYKPRLLIPGKGTPQLPHRYHRDAFALLPYQVNARKFVIPYYVVTVDASRIWLPKKDPFDPARYDMPEQDFEVTIGNLRGPGAKVSAYDPLNNTAVPVEVVTAKTSSGALTVKLKTVDYPRILLVEEQAPGPQILDPQVTAAADGTLSVSWKTNIPVNAVKVTYGKDWQNRGANELTVPGGKQEYLVKIPTGAKGVLAARIKVVTDGLTNVWPRWDEDPQGQTVVPGSAKADVARLRVGAPPVTSATIEKLTAPEGVVLTATESNTARGYTLRTPPEVAFSGGPDDRETILGQGPGAGPNTVRLRLRYVPDSFEMSETLLPFAAVGDVVSRRRVQLPTGARATLVDFTFLPEQHPGMTGLTQRYLLVANEKTRGVLVLSAQGSAAAMQAQDKILTAIFASVSTAP